MIALKCINAVPNVCRNHRIIVNFARSMSLIRRTEERLRAADDLPNSYELIYKAPMENYFIIGQNVTTATCLAAVGMGLFWYGGQELVYPIDVSSHAIAGNQFELIGSIVGFFVANFTIRNLCSKYPLRIYRNRLTNKYRAIFIGQLPMQTTSFEFSKGTMRHVPPRGVLPWRESRYIADGRKMLLLENAFRCPADLNSMLR